MRITLPADAVGYVFQTECLSEGWSYVGQSTRLDTDHLDGYFGSGEVIRQVLSQRGTGALQKRLLAVAKSELELHYFEMLHIANARKNGLTLLNGDFGGPRPFPEMQRALREVLPNAMQAAREPERFLRVLEENRELVEQAITAVIAVPVDDFYAGLERDLLAIEDLTHECPTCGAAVGNVCRTNSKSLTKPQNPSRNHGSRPRRDVAAQG